jgi:hypothetical protein
VKNVSEERLNLFISPHSLPISLKREFLEIGAVNNSANDRHKGPSQVRFFHRDVLFLGHRDRVKNVRNVPDFSVRTAFASLPLRTPHLEVGLGVLDCGILAHNQSIANDANDVVEEFGCCQGGFR